MKPLDGEVLELRGYAPVPVRLVGAVSLLLALGSTASFLFAGKDLSWVAIFGAVGLCLGFPCHGWRVRCGRPQALDWYGLGLPWGVSLPIFFWRRPLEGCLQVEYREDIRTHRNDNGMESESYSYPVQISGSWGTRTTVELGSMFEARQAAKRICRFLDLPLAEQSASGQVVTGPAELGLPLRERILLLGLEPREPSRPQACRFTPRVSVDGVRIDLPRPPVGAGLIAAGFFGLLLAAGAGIFASLAGPRAPANLPLWAAAPFLLLCLPLAHSLLSRVRVQVSAAKLSVETRLFGLVPLRTRFPTGELEFLEEISDGTGPVRDTLGPAGPGLRAASDRALMEFGWGLSAPERAYLKDLLYYYAAS